MLGDSIASALWAATRQLATTRRCISSIIMVLLAGGGNSAAIAQDPRSPVYTIVPSPGFEAQVVKVDEVQTDHHRAAVAVTPDQTRFWIQIDRAGSLYSSVDRENGGNFIPQRILNIFDLPGEVVAVTQGVNSRCGIRYSVSSLMGAGGTSLFIGRCGQTYNFRPQGSSLLATSTGTGSSEVIQYARASTSVLVVPGNSTYRSSSNYMPSSNPNPATQAQRPVGTATSQSGDLDSWISYIDGWGWAVIGFCLIMGAVQGGLSGFLGALMFSVVIYFTWNIVEGLWGIHEFLMDVLGGKYRH